MNTTVEPSQQKLFEDLVDALNLLFGRHPGFRAVHAKGLVCTGSFKASPDAAAISKAAHLNTDTTPLTLRLSNFAGVPGIPDGDPNASPRGISVRFQTAAGDCDIVAHSFDGFPVKTAEEFLAFANALAASAPGAPSPTAIEQFASTHPAAAHFLQTPKPIPVSFANESFFGVNAFRFVNAQGQVKYGRYRIEPIAGNKYLQDAEAAAKAPDFLQEELKERLNKAPVQYRLMLQIAEDGDPVDDGSKNWPAERKQVELGVISLESVMPDSDEAQKRLIFDPLHLIDGIELSEDPLPAARSAVYGISFARRNPSK